MRTTEIRPLKDSPVYWIKKIPVNWETKPVKRVMSLVANPVGNDWDRTELLSLTQKGVIPRDIESGKGKFPADFSTYQLVDNNQLVMCLFDIDETPRAVGLARQPGMVTGAYSVFLFSGNNDPRYFYYFFLWLDIQKALKPFYTGLRKVVRPGTFASLQIPHPPVEEQSQISNFLDRETAKIDALIAEQQRLIELLQEKRQAVISHAVTKGLNPNAPMKDSGVEWLGEVPEHWDVIRIKNIGRSIIGLTYSPADVVSEENGMPVLRASNIQNGSLDWEDTVFVSVKPDPELLIKPGDILICARSGSRSLIGKNVLIRPSDMQREMTFGAFMTILRCIDPPFTRWTLSSTVFKAQAGAYMSTTINQLTASTLMGTALAFPPEEERANICCYLKEKTKKMGHLIDEANQSIKLLQERRSALISAAVTGQIDVRGLVEREGGEQ
jgi:type I restriction enzyme S subunit